MKMDPENKSNKAKHFQTIENKKINGWNIKREKIEGLSYKQKKVVRSSSSKSDTNNGKKCHAFDLSAHLIKTCTKQRNIFATYKEKREIPERLKEYNNIHTNNNRALVCFETKEEAQREGFTLL